MTVKRPIIAAILIIALCASGAAAQNPFDQLSNTLSSAWNNITAGFNQTFGQIQNVTQSLGNQASNATQSLGDQADNATQSLTDQVNNVTQQGAGGLGVPNATSNPLRQAWDTVANFTSNIGQGFSNFTRAAQEQVPLGSPPPVPPPAGSSAAALLPLLGGAAGAGLLALQLLL